jgi:3-hydroxyisobutyrate dehydrogenase-like beta-hydroxyacid dehydrogenase
MSEVGFIGVGTMGGPMAANLARAGRNVVVHDIDGTVVAALARLPGVTVVGSPAEVAAQVSVLFTCLPNDTIVRGTYLDTGGIASGGRPGLVTCDCSTVSPGATLEIHAALAGRGIHHMDTPMLGSQPEAVSGDIFFIVGGDRARLQTIAPYLEIMGRLHMHVGGPGSANLLKLAHNGLAAVTAVAVTETLALCVQSGVDPSIFYEVVRSGGGMAYGMYFERRAKRVIDGNFSPTFTAELMLKDARLAVDLARSVKAPVPLLEETTRTYEQAVAGGWGREDFSAVAHVIEQRIGRKLSAG